MMKYPEMTDNSPVTDTILIYQTRSRETARRFVSLNILLSHSKSFEMTASHPY